MEINDKHKVGHNSTLHKNKCLWLIARTKKKLKYRNRLTFEGGLVEAGDTMPWSGDVWGLFTAILAELEPETNEQIVQ